MCLLVGTGRSRLQAAVTMRAQTFSPCSQVFGVSIHLEVVGHTATPIFRGTTGLFAAAAAPPAVQKGHPSTYSGALVFKRTVVLSWRA